MFARVNVIQGPPGETDDGLGEVRERILPAAEQLDGFAGMLVLEDRKTGKTLGITFWDTEEHLRDSEEAAARLREEGVSTSRGSEIVAVERYEVVLDALTGGRDG